ncbi:MAG: cytochrome c oxidase assembly protein [Granulosicoccus sp.]|nr:cytochrome c oxidase assembly protein [Granulosicoccus sp.]
MSQGVEAARKPPSHGRVAGKMLLLACAMFGFGYLMVPLYNIICEVTGLNGKTGRVSASAIVAAPVAEDREIIVEFTASVNQSGSWEFRPNAKTMIVKPGILYHASYHAKNLSSSAVVAQATPSVTPFSAARYFNKTECFCFTRQSFEPGGSMDMPLSFVIDEDIPINVDRVTLSYTFFRSPDQS